MADEELCGALQHVVAFDAGRERVPQGVHVLPALCDASVLPEAPVSLRDVMPTALVASAAHEVDQLGRVLIIIPTGVG